MRNITRTIYGANLQTAMLLGLPFELAANSTLNEKLTIEAGVAPPTGEIPRAKYYCIGNGGHRNVTGADGIPYTAPIPHRSSDAALYNQLPFVLRETNNDLSTVERAKYGLRRSEVHGGTNYYAYYLKRMDMETVDNVLYRTTVTDGVSNSLPFTPSAGNLSPVAPAVGSDGVVETDGDYLSSTATILVDFTSTDVDELVNVANIIYGNENMAAISEIGICSGIDKVVTANGPGSTTFNFNEVIAAQIMSHVTAYYPMAYATEGFNFQIQMGATEPLLGE